jgi:hypothetical protein
VLPFLVLHLWAQDTRGAPLGDMACKRRSAMVAFRYQSGNWIFNRREASPNLQNCRHLPTRSGVQAKALFPGPFIRLLRCGGRGDWIRTSDLPIPEPDAYQAEPRPTYAPRRVQSVGHSVPRSRTECSRDDVRAIAAGLLSLGNRGGNSLLTAGSNRGLDAVNTDRSLRRGRVISAITFSFAQHQCRFRFEPGPPVALSTVEESGLAENRRRHSRECFRRQCV